MKALLIHHEVKKPIGAPEDDDDEMLEPDQAEYEAEGIEAEDEEAVEEEEDNHNLAGIALCVGAGSFQDLEFKIEGLAHFVGE